MTALIIFGAKYLIAVVALIAAWALWRNAALRLQLTVVVLISLPFAYALARIAGMLYSHHQPFAELGTTPLVPHEIDNSFPSDHTLFSGVFAFVAWMADRRLGSLAFLLTLLVGLSRMLAGLHWAVDVIAAVGIAGLVVWLVARCTMMLWPQKQ